MVPRVHFLSIQISHEHHRRGAGAWRWRFDWLSPPKPRSCLFLADVVRRTAAESGMGRGKGEHARATQGLQGNNIPEKPFRIWFCEPSCRAERPQLLREACRGAPPIMAPETFGHVRGKPGQNRGLGGVCKSIQFLIGECNKARNAQVDERHGHDV